ncbi:MAG: GNAT family N-acetyltransferase [bacterium]
MEIHKFSERDAKQWEDFVPISNNGTIFHYLRFLGYHPSQRFKNHHLVIKEKHNILALFPAVIEDNTVISHKGASYGGFVLKQGIGIHKTCLIVEHLIGYFKERGFQRIILTQTPLIYYKEPDQYIDFALLKNGFHYRKREITAVIPIDARDPLLTFHADARRSTKKAMREGVGVTISDDFNTFYAILKHNLGMRHNVSPTHSLEELTRLKNMFPDDIFLFAAHLKRKMIGGIVIFCAHQNVILAFYISHDSEFQIYRPVNLLFYEVLKWGRSKNFKYLDLGTFTLNMTPNWGLGRFKENHNARGFLRDSFELNI